MADIRIGIVGLGDNTRNRHVPGLLACEGVEISAVCNRRPESTAAAASEFNIPHTFQRWEELVESDNVDAVVIGTWPYLHCPITLAALRAGKHVLTEARMSLNLAEAEQMLDAARQHPNQVVQIVPSPFGLYGHEVIKGLLDNDQIGELREFVVLGTNAAFLDPTTPIHWRQQEQFSGINMLALGILHEPLIRWFADPVRVMAHNSTFIPERPGTSGMEAVTTPDSVHILSQLPNGAAGVYHLSGVMQHGPGFQIQLYGTKGTLKYEFTPQERILFGGVDSELRQVEVAPELAGGWRVEEEFINAIRGIERVEFTTFEMGVRYMRFTQAVADSAAAGREVQLDVYG